METVPLLQLDHQVKFLPHQMEHPGIIDHLAQLQPSLESLTETVNS